METARALTQGDETAEPNIPVLAPSKLKAAYRNLAFPAEEAREDSLRGAPRPIFPGSMRARHIVIIGLETAPRKFYPIIDDPGLVHFHEMAGRAIVSRI